MKNLNLPKPYLDVNDIQQMLGCKRSKAYDYILIIKSVSDVGKTAGRVMISDYLKFCYGTTDIASILNFKQGGNDGSNQKETN